MMKNKRKLRKPIREAIEMAEISITVGMLIYITIRTYAFMIGIDL